MQEVNIFIDVAHTGNLKTGTGTYGIVLEYLKKNGIPVTREIYKGLNKTTKNRTALISCIESLSKLKRACIVDMFINNTYIVNTITQQWYFKWNFEDWTNRGKTIPNKELWQQLFKLLEIHKVKFHYKKINGYTSYIKTMIRTLDLEFKEDEGNV